MITGDFYNLWNNQHEKNNLPQHSGKNESALPIDQLPRQTLSTPKPPTSPGLQNDDLWTGALDFEFPFDSLMAQTETMINDKVSEEPPLPVPFPATIPGSPKDPCPPSQPAFTTNDPREVPPPSATAPTFHNSPRQKTAGKKEIPASRPTSPLEELLSLESYARSAEQTTLQTSPEEIPPVATIPGPSHYQHKPQAKLGPETIHNSSICSPTRARPPKKLLGLESCAHSGEQTGEQTTFQNLSEELPSPVEVNLYGNQSPDGNMSEDSDSFSSEKVLGGLDSESLPENIPDTPQLPEDEKSSNRTGVTQKDFDKLDKLLNETVDCFKKAYDIKTGKKLIRKNRIKEILSKKEKKILIDLLGKKFPGDLQLRLEKVAERNLEIMNVVGYFSMRLIQYCASPIKFFCEEF